MPDIAWIGERNKLSYDARAYNLPPPGIFESACLMKRTVIIVSKWEIKLVRSTVISRF